MGYVRGVVTAAVPFQVHRRRSVENNNVNVKTWPSALCLFQEFIEEVSTQEELSRGGRKQVSVAPPTKCLEEDKMTNILHNMQINLVEKMAQNTLANPVVISPAVFHDPKLS